MDSALDLKVQSVPKIWTSVSSYNIGEPIHTVVVNHESTYIRFLFFIRIWGLVKTVFVKDDCLSKFTEC